MIHPRRDLAYQHYRTSTGEIVAAYTLGENRFTVLEDDAAILVGKLLNRMDPHELLEEIQAQKGPSAKGEAAAFLDSIAPLLFTDNEGLDIDQVRPPVRPTSSIEWTEEDRFYEYCAMEKIFSVSAWELTYTCNQHCIHCYNPHHEASESLNTLQWMELLYQARDLGLLRLSLTGGEASTHPGFWDILAKARSLHLALDILTNGLLFKERSRARDLASFYPRSVQCSLYGASAATHEQVTGITGSWEETLRCLQNFAELGVPLVVKCPAMTINYREIPEVAQLAANFGAVLQVDVNITARNDGASDPIRLRLDTDQLSWLFMQPNLPIYQGLEKLIREGGSSPASSDPICGAGANGLCIQPDGSVTPCLSLMLPLGRIPAQSLQDVWKGDCLINWRRKTRGDREGCEACTLDRHCSFCPGIALHDAGSPQRKNPNDCRVACIRASQAKRLSDSSK